MSHVNVLTNLSLSVLFILIIFLLIPVAGSAQSTNRDLPTPVSSYPISGNLGTGTYYYEISESLISEGESYAMLIFTPPVGGGSVSASFSGPRCCTGEPIVGESTGYEATIRRSTRFGIAGQQNLLVTIDISVGDRQTIEFSLTLSRSTGSGPVVVTPPPATPPTKPTTPTGAVCTDLGVAHFSATGTGLTRVITGEVHNLTTTHPYKGFPRGQWIEIYDITDSEKDAPRVTFIRLPDIMDPGQAFSYRALHTMTVDRRTRYKIKIVYSPNHATDRSPYNDDCNPDNNTTRLQLIGGVPRDDKPIQVEKLPRP